MVKQFNVGVVGASGMVGRELLEILETREFPVKNLYPFASGRKKSFVHFKGRKYFCGKPVFKELKKSDIVFFVSNEEVARRYAKKLADSGVWCIDDSSMFRMDKNVPLIIPEINFHEISQDKKLIAGPNCTLTGIAVAGFQIHEKFKIKEIRIATYQSVSGAGKDALKQFENELTNRSDRRVARRVFPHPIAFNLFPHVGSFDREGNSGEEIKVALELKKIWRDDSIKISTTAVRVPVIRGHSLAVWVKTEKSWKLTEIENILRKTEGVQFFKNPYKYPTPLKIEKTFEVKVGRLRKSQTSGNEFQMWIVSDNLYKGAALNSVQIAEYITGRIENIREARKTTC